MSLTLRSPGRRRHTGGTLLASRPRSFLASAEGDECLNHDPSGWIGVETLIKLLLLLRTSLQSPLAHQHYAAAARSLAESWGEEARERRARHGPEAVPLQLLGQLPQLLAQFTIRLEPQVALEIMRPLVEGVEEHAREVARVLHYLLFAQDPFEGKSSYWEIWQAFADRIRRARWVAHARQRSGEHELLQAIFVGLSTEWKSSVRHWPRLAGQEARLHSLIAALPPSAAAFESYVGFFYAIGQQSLPEGFTYLADLLRRETSVQLSFDNTISMLESILRRYVYGHPHAVKRSDDLRKAVLFILDALVERGSSVAYRMRDDFVTPLPK